MNPFSIEPARRADYRRALGLAAVAFMLSASTVIALLATIIETCGRLK